MPIADHIIFGAYGFWLPNDPRGSGSDYVRQWKILSAGRATKVSTRRSVAHVKANFDPQNMPKLTYPPVSLDGRQALAASHGFAKAIEESDYKVYACSILPEHVHIVAARHKHGPRLLAGHLKGRATQRLEAEGRHPLAQFRTAAGEIPSPWSVNSWAVFLDTHEDVVSAIKYVRDNPLHEGKRAQQWSFVIPYRGWAG